MTPKADPVLVLGSFSEIGMTRQEALALRELVQPCTECNTNGGTPDDEYYWHPEGDITDMQLRDALQRLRREGIND